MIDANRQNHVSNIGGMQRPAHRLVFAVVYAALLVVALGGCTVRLISDYDESIDRTATQLQKDMDTFLTGLETGTAAPAVVNYGASKLFYATYATEVRSVMIRAQAHPKNDLSVEQYSLMLKSLRELEVSHRGDEGHEDEGTIPVAAIPAYRDMFNQAWGAIIELEVAKKR